MLVSRCCSLTFLHAWFHVSLQLVLGLYCHPSHQTSAPRDPSSDQLAPQAASLLPTSHSGKAACATKRASHRWRADEPPTLFSLGLSTHRFDATLPAKILGSRFLKLHENHHHNHDSTRQTRTRCRYAQLPSDPPPPTVLFFCDPSHRSK